MRPALSIVFFTVVSGAGLGLFALLVLEQWIAGTNGLGSHTHTVGGLVALTMVALGLLSSTLHLANPRNAWRAFSQFRYSWLSREAVLAVLFFPAALLYLFGARIGLSASVLGGIGALAFLIASAILFCTGMIYACLRTIPQWHTRLVPLAYVVLGFFSGGLLLLALAAADGRALGRYMAAALTLLALAGVVKGVYFHRFRSAQANGAHTLTQALGVTTAQAKLLDVGHASRTFLTDEFVFRMGRRHAQRLRILFAVLSLVVPLVVIGIGTGKTWVLAGTALVALVGLAIERWLFFAEAQHVVRLYHGQRAV